MIAITLPTWLSWLDSLAWPWMLLALPLPILMRWWPSRPGAGAALRVPYAADQLQSLGAAAGGAGHAWAARCCGWRGPACAWRPRDRSSSVTR